MTERAFKVGDVVTIIGRGESQICEIRTNIYGDTVYLGKHHGLGSEWFNRDELDGLAEQKGEQKMKMKVPKEVMEENRIEQMLLEESLGGDRSEYQDCKGNLLELAKYFVEQDGLGDGDKVTHYWDGIGLRVTVEVGDYDEVGNRHEVDYSDR